MRLRYWTGFVACSLLLHTAFLWPLPDPPAQEASAAPLKVSLPSVISSNQASDIEPTSVKTIYSEQPVEQGKVGRTVKTPPSLIKQKITAENVSLLAGKNPRQLVEAKSKVAGKEEAGVPTVVPDALKDDLGPSISRYRLALAAEAIRARVSIEKLIEPGFKGRIIVLVQLHEVGALPQVSLEQGAGFDALDQQVLSTFRQAVAAVPISIAGDVEQVSLRLPVHFERPPNE